MPKPGDLKWDELLNKSSDYDHSPSALWLNNPAVGVAPKSSASTALKKGEVPTAPSNEEVARYILSGFVGSTAQWKDSEYLHKEVISEAQAVELRKNWENSINNFYKGASAPINAKNQDTAWATGKSFNSTLTEEEKYRRNMYTGDSE